MSFSPPHTYISLALSLSLSLSLSYTNAHTPQRCQELSSSAIEATALRETVDSLKEEFSRTLAKSDKRLEAIRAERDAALTKVAGLGRDTEKVAREAQAQQGRCDELVVEAQGLAMQLGKEKEKTRALIRERKVLEDGMQHTYTHMHPIDKSNPTRTMHQ